MKVLIFTTILCAILNAIILDCAVDEIKSNFTEDELKYIDEKIEKKKRKKSDYLLAYFPLTSTLVLVILVIGYKEAINKIVSEYKAIIGKV